jgi:DNA-binding transcriptional MerR regulator
MTYTIAQAAEKVNLTPYTLRYYEKVGLLSAVKRGSNGIRVFQDSDIEWLYIIRCMREAGMSVADLKHYVDLCAEGEKTVPERREIILHRKELLEERLREVNLYLKRINVKLNIYNEILAKQRPDNLVPNSKIEIRSSNSSTCNCCSCPGN